jgi:hypothetical protein
MVSAPACNGTIMPPPLPVPLGPPPRLWPVDRRDAHLGFELADRRAVRPNCAAPPTAPTRAAESPW